MGQEFVIKSTLLEDKINQLLPSQGGAAAGVDLSASTTIIPIIDLTESAEGSVLREDLQKSLSLTSVTHTSTVNATNAIINTTGYYRIFGSMYLPGAGTSNISLTDGFSTKVLLVNYGLAGFLDVKQFDFIVYLPAGVTCNAYSSSASIILSTTTRQIADIDGNLVNPL